MGIEELYGRIECEIEGIEPGLLMNRVTPERLKGKPKGPGTVYDPEQEALEGAYIAEIDDKEQLYIPSASLYGCIIGGAGGYKLGKRAARSTLAGAIRIRPEKIPLGKLDYVVDVRPVVINGNRVIRGRANVFPWQASFDIAYYRRVLKKESVETTLKEILETAGITQGVMDFRPQHKGWFGTFEVKKFEVVS